MSAVTCSDADCVARATQTVTVLLDFDDTLPVVPGNGRLVSQPYCTGHAADVVQEVAHGNPPNAELVCVVMNVVAPGNTLTNSHPALVDTESSQADNDYIREHDARVNPFQSYWNQRPEIDAQLAELSRLLDGNPWSADK